MQKNIYSAARFQLDPFVVRNLEKLDEKRPWFDLISLYVFTAIALKVSIYISYQFSFFFYPILAFLIAGRQGAFLQLIHEASHNLISKNKKINDFYGSWLTSFLVGVNYNGYTNGHLVHHAHTATENEPKSDSEKYREVNFKEKKIYILFIKDLLGISALQIFFSYGQENKNSENKNQISKKVIFLLKLSFIQILILAFFNFNILNYILFWLYPAMGPHMFLMRIRGIAEHGLNKQIGEKVNNSKEGQYYTRSFLTDKNKYKFFIFSFIEKLLIGSFYVHYHHEHHLNAKIPYYNLKKYHELAYNNVINNVEQKKYYPTYEKGYFSATFKTCYAPEEVLS